MRCKGGSDKEKEWVDIHPLKNQSCQVSESTQSSDVREDEGEKEMEEV
jgi:hypothetical protein